MASLRASAVTALGIVALAGAAVAGVEKALAPQALPDKRAEGGPPPAAGPPASAVFPPPGSPAGGSVIPDSPTYRSPSGGPRAHGRAARPPCAAPVRVCVQLSRSTAWLLTSEGVTLGPVPVRHGRPDSPTPSGMFPVEFMNAIHVHSMTGVPMPFAVFFAGDLALYEADLSQPSAGSIRLPPGSAELFFRNVSVGDLIQVVP